MIADYLFNKATVAGHRVMVLLTEQPLTRAELTALTSMTEAGIKALPAVVAWALPSMDVTSFGYLRTRNPASTYSASVTAAFSLPSTCTFTPARSGTVSAMTLVLMNAGVAVRSYQCLAGTEVTLSRNTVSIEDKAFVSKILIGGMIGQQIGDLDELAVLESAVFTVDIAAAAESTASNTSSVMGAVLISEVADSELDADSVILR